MAIRPEVASNEGHVQANFGEDSGVAVGQPPVCSTRTTKRVSPSGRFGVGDTGIPCSSRSRQPWRFSKPSNYSGQNRRFSTAKQPQHLPNDAGACELFPRQLGQRFSVNRSASRKSSYPQPNKSCIAGSILLGWFGHLDWPPLRAIAGVRWVVVMRITFL